LTYEAGCPSVTVKDPSHRG